MRETIIPRRWMEDAPPDLLRELATRHRQGQRISDRDDEPRPFLVGTYDDHDDTLYPN